MKKILLFFILTEFSCKNYEAKKHISDDTVTKPNIESFNISQNKHDATKYFIASDSIDIPSLGNDKNRYGKKEFNNIVQYLPELTNKYPKNPEITYNYLSKEFISVKDSTGKINEISFSSENGQDEYYQLYAYFLKNMNGEIKYRAQRQSIINACFQINDIFQTLQSGGTFFGHQYYRIPAIAEYSIFLYDRNKEQFVRKYNYLKQKELFIATLKQLVIDEESVNYDYIDKRNKAQEFLYQYY
jgi:hypothetical protein